MTKKTFSSTTLIKVNLKERDPSSGRLNGELTGREENLFGYYDRLRTLNGYGWERDLIDAALILESESILADLGLLGSRPNGRHSLVRESRCNFGELIGYQNGEDRNNNGIDKLGDKT